MTRGPLKRVRFKIGEVLPSKDQLSVFMVNVGAALNDLLFVNRVLMDRLDEDSDLLAAREAQYLLRTSIGHLWELDVCIRSWHQVPAVAELINSLEPPKRAKLETLLAISEPGEDAVAKTIVHLRNVATWHYTTPAKAKHLRLALKEAEDTEGTIEFGGAYSTYRASCVDDVLIQLAHQLLDGDEETAVRLLMQRLSAHTVDAIQLLDSLCQGYFTEARGCVLETGNSE